MITAINIKACTIGSACRIASNAGKAAKLAAKLPTEDVNRVVAFANVGSKFPHTRDKLSLSKYPYSLLVIQYGVWIHPHFLCC